MKELSDFMRYYEGPLSSDIIAFEEERVRLLYRLFSYFFVALGIAGGVGILFLNIFTAPANVYANIFVLVGLGISLAYIYNYLFSDFVDNFKSSVIKKIVSFIDEGLVYSRNGCVSESYLIQSGIFTRIPSRTNGEDLVSGIIGSTRIEFSDLHAEYRTEYWDYDLEYYGNDSRETDWLGRRRTNTYHTLFRGLFFVAHINRRFCARTVVLPDLAESLLGGIGSKLQSLNMKRGPLVKMDDPEFERSFVVYSDDQREPRVILDADMMKRIMELKNRVARKIYLSFTGSMVCVAVSSQRNFLEPKIFRTLLDYNLFEDYFKYLSVAIGIVDGLGLNRLNSA